MQACPVDTLPAAAILQLPVAIEYMQGVPGIPGFTPDYCCQVGLQIL